MTIEWMKTVIPLKYDKNDHYIMESLNHIIKYIDIKRVLTIKYIQNGIADIKHDGTISSFVFGHI